MLTLKQKELLLFIHERLQHEGVPPSFDEMKAALDLKSKSGIHRLITALEERGFIRRLPHRARALEVVKLPTTGADAAPRAGLRVIEGSHDGLVDQLHPVDVSSRGGMMRLPESDNSCSLSHFLSHLPCFTRRESRRSAIGRTAR